MEPVILRTARLTLSVPTEADVDAIFEACQDAGIQRYTTVPSPYERRHAEGFIPFARSRWSDGVEATWALRDGDTLAGMIGLHGITLGGSGEIGYWMSPPSRRRGLLTEAARAVIDWGFSYEGAALQRIEWRAVVGNVGSARVARGLGFRYEGVLRKALANSFGREDGWIAGLLPGDDRMPQPWPMLETP
ncbi:Protein N-acetyltransferase, RimJ/RimL family [Microbacterium sp. cf046]|uniref:GNAT family N-acetyltransferase n=1 Tax=Microbacterium sp. cf046 TaxID=1761803 RepID=UPI0008F26677|nr:GNAT family N-acetyltransferase [Microbacterium sp. cf046]SFR95365.1 Protein N-acetyltransferase, RimJ/RimL family [Microbacterium sp. cf046]